MVAQAGGTARSAGVKGSRHEYFFDVYGIKPLAGRLFGEEYAADKFVTSTEEGVPWTVSAVVTEAAHTFVEPETRADQRSNSPIALAGPKIMPAGVAHDPVFASAVRPTFRLTGWGSVLDLLPGAERIW